GLPARLRGRAAADVPGVGVVAVQVDARVGDVGVGAGRGPAAGGRVAVLTPPLGAGLHARVAVRVDDRDDPDLPAVDQVGEQRVAAVVVDEHVQGAQRQLGRDDLAGVVGAQVEDARPGAAARAGHAGGPEVS